MKHNPNENTKSTYTIKLPQGLPKSKLRPYMKSHGCRRPFNRLQIVSWIVFAICFSAFFVLCLPAMPDNVKVKTHVVN